VLVVAAMIQDEGARARSRRRDRDFGKLEVNLHVCVWFHVTPVFEGQSIATTGRREHASAPVSHHVSIVRETFVDVVRDNRRRSRFRVDEANRTVILSRIERGFVLVQILHRDVRPAQKPLLHVFPATFHEFHVRRRIVDLHRRPLLLRHRFRVFLLLSRFSPRFQLFRDDAER
jgi:hypothetical protein